MTEGIILTVLNTVLTKLQDIEKRLDDIDKRLYNLQEQIIPKTNEIFKYVQNEHELMKIDGLIDQFGKLDIEAAKKKFSPEIEIVEDYAPTQFITESTKVIDFKEPEDQEEEEEENKHKSKEKVFTYEEDEEEDEDEDEDEEAKHAFRDIKRRKK